MENPSGQNGWKEKPPRDFKGIWIGREIWESQNLSVMQKVLFVEIHSLDNERGCYASNRYFSEFFGVSERQIRNLIGSLRDKGFVTVKVVGKNQRTIRAAGKYRRVSTEEKRALAQGRADLARGMNVSRGVGRKLPGGAEENFRQGRKETSTQ